jgi:hypothetical protein
MGHLPRNSQAESEWISPYWRRSPVFGLGQVGDIPQVCRFPSFYVRE